MKDLPKSDEGEFELVLGNRQLISVFLIVVILLGVFFSMGYIVGRNSAPSAGPDLARTTKAAAEPPPDTSASASAPTPLVEPAPVPESKRAAAEPVTTHPEQPAPVAETPAPKPAPPAAAKEKKSPAAPPAASGRASVTGEPAPGQYWQVVATARPDAEIVAEALSKKGLHAIIAPAPRDGFFRVLVGPLPDAAAQAQARTQLEAAGFKNPIVRKY